MNIYITKALKAHFVVEKTQRNMYGGSDIIAQTILKIVQLYPQHTFYYVGSNDIDKMLNCPKNLINLDKVIKQNINKISNDKYRNRVESILNYISKNNIKFDMFMIFVFFTDLPVEYWKYNTQKGTVIKSTEINKNWCYQLAPLKYSDAPIYYYNDDLDCLKWPRDVRLPNKVYSQYKGEWNFKIFKKDATNTSDLIDVILNIEYKPIELLFLRTKKKIDWRTINKTGGFEIICNQSSDSSLKRFEYLKKWVLDYNPNQIIYGKWTKKNKEAMDKINAQIMPTPMVEMEDKMFNTKYTLVIPLNKKHPEFVTQKTYSMIYYGIIPFWCKTDYDTNNIYNKIPDYIKVETPEELYQKINELENNKELYKSILNQLYDLLEDKYFSDEIIYEMFDDILYTDGTKRDYINTNKQVIKKLF